MSRRASLAAGLAAVLVLGCGPTHAANGDLFAYDASAPLDVREAASTVADGVRTIELAYASPKGGRVPATLVLPASTETPPPAVIFQHGAGDASREDFRSEAEDLARSGLAALLVDAPLARTPRRNWLTFQRRDRAGYVQNVVDIRRGIDLLERRTDVDARRVALVGHSYGGSIVGVVAAVEPRVDAVVVMSGPGRMTDYFRLQGQAWVRRAPPRLRPSRRRQLVGYLAYMRAVDAAEHVGRATAPLLFQFGRDDAMPARWFETYVDAAPRDKRVEWYDAGHMLCDCATRDRRAWLLERLR